MEMDGQERLPALRPAGAPPANRRLLIAGRCGLYFALGLGMSFARVLGDGAPFGLALVACAGAGTAGVGALLGAALGYLLGGLEWGIRYIAGAVLIYTIAFVFRELPLYRQELFMPSAAGAVMLLTGLLAGLGAESGTMPLWAKLSLETALAFGGAYFFRDALNGSARSSEMQELRHSVSLMALAACGVMSLSRVVFLDLISLGRVLALLLVMCAAMKAGMLSGAAVGTVLGMAMDAAGPGAPFYTMAYAFSGLFAGVFGRHGRFLFVLSFVLADALAVLCAWHTEVHLGALFETFCASVIFLLLPAPALSQLALALQSVEQGSGEANLRRFAARRVRNLSEAYGELFELVRRGVEDEENDENIARVFDRAADAVCVRCREKNRCWNAEYIDTLSAMNDATRAMTEKGCLAPEDLPAHFRERCPGLTGFTAAVNGELRALAYRRQLRTRLSENRLAAWGQYTEISQLLAQVADELGSLNGADPLAEQRLLRYLSGLGIDAEAAVYRDGGGRLRVVIESGLLSPLTRQEDYLEKLSEVVGVRLCRRGDAEKGSSRLTLLEAEPLAVSVGIASLKKQGEAVNGDRGSYFKTDDGVLCVLLSDGMGSGAAAAADSARVISILEKFLRSGVDPAVAMKILNSVMLLRGGDNWGYATVDLMCVDLFSGEACFYKYGAAPSYVRSGRSIRRIRGESLAPGLSAGEGTAPDVVRMRLKPGCMAVIASDGVLADEEDGWLRARMEADSRDMRALASSILRDARERYGEGDDMTVLTVRVEERR